MTEKQLRDPALATQPLRADVWLLRIYVLDADRRASWRKMRDRIDELEAVPASHLNAAEKTELANLRRRMAEEESIPFRVADPREIEEWLRQRASSPKHRGRAA